MQILSIIFIYLASEILAVPAGFHSNVNTNTNYNFNLNYIELFNKLIGLILNLLGTKQDDFKMDLATITNGSDVSSTWPTSS